MGRKEDNIAKAQSIMRTPKYIRNIGTAAHIDHGKSVVLPWSICAAVPMLRIYFGVRMMDWAFAMLSSLRPMIPPFYSACRLCDPFNFFLLSDGIAVHVVLGSEYELVGQAQFDGLCCLERCLYCSLGDV